MRGMLDLELLALGLGQCFVIGDLRDHACHRLTEAIQQILVCRFSVLDRVVEDCCLQNDLVIDASRSSQQCCQSYGMVDVGACVSILASLVPVSVRCERDGLK